MLKVFSQGLPASGRAINIGDISNTIANRIIHKAFDVFL